MKLFTKMFLTLGLLCMAGVANAGQETLIKSQDYSNPIGEDGNPVQGYPYWRMGDCNGTASFDVVDGVLKIVNNQVQTNNWDLQPYILDWFNMKDQYDYRVEITMRANGDFDGVNLSIGTWQGAVNVGMAFTASENFVKYTATLEKSTVATSGNNAHILFQMGKFQGTVEIQKVELYEIAPDEPIKEPVWTNIIVNSDLSGNDLSCFYSKEYPAADPTTATVVDGVIVVNSAAKVSQDWDTQFWIYIPQVLSAGTKFKVSFDYKASAQSSVETQCQNAPTQFVHWACIGNVDFTTEWNTFEAIITVPAECNGGDNNNGYKNNFHSIAFNLTKAEAITYYFDNIVIAVDEEIAENPQPFPEEPSFVIPAIPEGFVNLTDIPFMNAAGETVLVDQNCSTAETLKALGAGSVVIGTSTVDANIYADFSDYEELVIICAKIDETNPTAVALAESAEGITYRVLMNRQPQDDGQGPLVEKQAVANADGYAFVSVADLTTVHVNAIKVGWGQPSNVVFTIAGKPRSQQPDPIVIPEIPEGYESLATIPFTNAAGEIVQVEQNFWTEENPKVLEAGNVVIGTGTVDANIFADYSEYTELMIICGKAEEDPTAAARAAAPSPEGIAYRVLINREPQADGQGPLTELRAVADADGYARVDLSDQPYVNLNAIKVGWGQPKNMVFAVVGKKDGGITDGISEVKTVNQSNVVYDLLGRRVAEPTHGLFIVNGKKVVR